MDFLVSYTVEDRDWAEWIASHLGSLGYSYALQDPPTPADGDPLAAAVGATAEGDDVIIVLSGALADAAARSGVPTSGRLRGPGRAVVVQIEQVEAPGDVALLPTARMHDAPDDYSISRDLLLLVVRGAKPQPGPREEGTAAPAATRTPLPAPVTVDEPFPVAEAPPLVAPTQEVEGRSEPALAGPLPASARAGLGTEAEREGPSRGEVEHPDTRSAGLLGLDWGERPWEQPEPATTAHAGGTATDDDTTTGAWAGNDDDGATADQAGATAEARAGHDRGGDASAEEAPTGGATHVDDERLDAVLANLRSLGTGVTDSSAAPVADLGSNGHLAPAEGAGAEATTAATSGAAAGTAEPAEVAEGEPEPMIDLRDEGEAAQAGARAADATAAHAPPVVPAPPLVPGTEMPAAARDEVPAAGEAAEGAAAEWAVAGRVPADAPADEAGAPHALAAPLVHLPHLRIASFWDRAAALERLTAGITTATAGPPAPGSAPVRRIGGPLASSWPGPQEAPSTGAPDLVTLHGPTGAGATALAVEHAARQLGRVDVAWWVRAGSPATWRADVTGLARAAGLDGTNDPVEAVRTWLASGPRWLLVLDGVTDWQAVTSLLPAEGRGQAVVTLARPALDATGVLDLGEFEDALATSFLLARTSRTDHAGAGRVVEHLGGLPATLELAGAFVSATGATFDEFLAAVDDSTPPPELVTARPSTSVESCVLASLRAVGETDPDATAAVLALARTADGAFPAALVDELTPKGAGVRELLGRYALLVVDGDQAAMPGLVRQAIGRLVTEGPDTAALVPLARALADHFGQAEDELAPHAAAVVLRSGDRLPVGLTAELAEPVITWSRRLGAHAEADALAAAAARATTAPPPAAEPPGAPVAPVPEEDSDDLDDLLAGGGAAYGQEDFASLLAGMAPGTEVITPGNDFAELAGPYAGGTGDEVDDLDDIETLTQRVASLEQAVGPDSLQVIALRHQLAAAHADAGDHAAASRLLAGVLEQCERTLGPDHPDTLTARANLAGNHAESGNYPLAINLQEQVVAEHERLLGGDDALTLTARNNLANYYASAGAHPQALRVQERVVEDYRRTHGDDHPNTLTAKHNLANSYADLDQQGEALELRTKVLEDRERILGPDHPQTLGARNNLANSHADLGRHDEALELRTRVLEDRERILGPDHPQTLGARNNLANSHADLGQHDAALLLRARVLEDRERILGPDHPHTLTARNNLANSYAALGRHREALDLRERALGDCERVLGAEHPHTLTARNNLANSYALLGDEARANQLRTEVLASQAGPTPAGAAAPPSAATALAPR
ncbi:MAG: tetratricopeptide repeat protein, partial [Acidimicrobiia bacterium]|nr:tetratricopeptide repeat protein [Acidimicrobiia bacterium]